MNQVLTIEKPPQFNAFQHPFLQELTSQIRSTDTFNRYQSWSDERLIERLIISPDQEAGSSENLNVPPEVSPAPEQTYVPLAKPSPKEWKHRNYAPAALSKLNQLLIHAFYDTLGVAIERKTGHATETFVQLKGKEFSSAVIFCGGVLVFYSLTWGYRSLIFLTIQELIESAEFYIENAVAKADQYLDFIY